MKLFYLLVISLITIHTAFTQTYLEPQFGVSFSKNVGFPVEGWNSFVRNDKNFNNKNWLYGLSLNQQLTEQFSIQLTGKFSKQLVGYNDIGIAGYSIVKYNRNELSIMPVYHFLTRFEFGIGFNYAQLGRFQMGEPYRNYWSSLRKEYKENQLGWSAKFSYLYKSLVLSINYHYLNTIEFEQNWLIRKSHHIDVVLSYRLNLLNVFSFKKKVDCPEISK